MATQPSGGSVITSDTAETKEAAAPAATEHAPYQRFEDLSTSESGLHYVRDRKSGTIRLLTEQELQDFSDPPPCAECGEQFGCEHFNCAGEPALIESEIELEVPPEWRPFARAEGLSRQDLERLKKLGEHEGEYRVISGIRPTCAHSSSCCC